MLRFFKRKKRINVSAVFNDCTRFQKLSCINFLVALAGIDGSQHPNELQCINKYVDVLNVTSQECINRLESFGSKQVVEDLKTLSFSQKQVLFRISLETIYADKPPEHLEIVFLESTFIEIGLNGQQQKEILRSVINSEDFLTT